MAENRSPREILDSVQTLVVKVGSSVIADKQGLESEQLAHLARQIAELRSRGLTVTLVSSGAIAAGGPTLGEGRPRTLPERQAAASIGQIRLMGAWANAFEREGISVAQILLDAEDLASRHRYLNAEHTIAALQRQGVMPIVNENDTVAVDELKFGDNDQLSALVASLVGAELLVLLSDVAGVFEADPRIDPEAPRIEVIENVDARTLARAGDGASELGTGGMRSKLEAARRAAQAGIPSLIADGRTPGGLLRALEPRGREGTLVLPRADRIARRKHWIAFSREPRGRLVCDSGAVEAVRERGRSLLPSGITANEGRFRRGDSVSLIDPDGREFARGLIAYDANDVTKIAGKRSQEIAGILGFDEGPAVVHCDDLVLLESSREDAEP